MEHLNLEVTITEEEIKLLANDLGKQEQEGEPCEDLRIQLAEREKKGKDLNLRIVICTQSPLRATNQDTVIELDVTPIVNPTTLRETSGWDEMLELQRQDKARSPPMHPVFSPKRKKTSYASKVVEKVVDDTVEKLHMNMTHRAINEEKKYYDNYFDNYFEYL